MRPQPPLLSLCSCLVLQGPPDLTPDPAQPRTVEYPSQSLTRSSSRTLNLSVNGSTNPVSSSAISLRVVVCLAWPLLMNESVLPDGISINSPGGNLRARCYETLVIPRVSANSPLDVPKIHTSKKASSMANQGGPKYYPP